MRTLISFLALLILAFFFLLPEGMAQCPMCRMTVESNYADGGSAGLGLNKGIIYLLLAPYLIVGGIAYFYWRNTYTPRGSENETH